MAGAACTKNEGLLFAALGAAWVAAAGRKWRDVAAVGLPVALCAGAWKLYVAVAMDVTNHSLAALGGGFPAPAEWLRRLAAAGGYGVMNLLMTATPLAMDMCGHPFADAAFVLEWHVIGMFSPSFFTGGLIRRFGVAGSSEPVPRSS